FLFPHKAKPKYPCRPYLPGPFAPPPANFEHRHPTDFPHPGLVPRPFDLSHRRFHPNSHSVMADLIEHHRRHDPPMGVSPVPHGPETGQEHEHYPAQARTTDSESERQIFSYLTHPDDSYNAEGTYWADLPLAKRVSFVNGVQSEE